MSAASHVAMASTVKYAPVLLATALVRVVAVHGEQIEVRALLDQGSEISLVTESLAQRLRLPRRQVSLPISGIGAKRSSIARGLISLELFSRSDASFSCEVDAYVLAKLTSYLPPVRVLDASWPHLDGLTLADPEVASAKGIDLVLGAEVYSRVLEDGVRKGASNTPIAQRTALGWILSGAVAENSDAPENARAAQSFQCSIDHHLVELLERFWVQEETTTRGADQLSIEDAQCEEHFASTHSRDSDGRYVVRLPFKKLPEDIGDSRAAALRMLSRQEAKFVAKPELKEDYDRFLKEYEALEHMSRVPKHRGEPPRSFYLPHHAVVRESSSTTRVRVVFNGSQRTSRGFSLNDLLHAGPKLQTDLADVITRWRSHAYAFSSDNEKMYRQVLVHPEDWDFQRIVWREGREDEIATYHLRTVTYGLTSAPYLAIKTLRQLAVDEGHRFPLAVDVINGETYMDDVLSGADELESAREKIRQVNGMLGAGGFTLQKWAANHDEILENIPPERKELSSPLSIEDGPLFRALGLLWKPQSDSFVFKADYSLGESRITKRLVLSRVAQLFDPLGWVAPIVVKAKIFMQELWSEGLEWDDSLSSDSGTRWEKFVRELEEVSKISVPRWLGSCASAVDSAKTRVAPLKRVTIPRLELSAAVLLARQISHVREVLKLENSPVHLWTDSTVTLAYIKGQPNRWKDYVRNRVTEIQALPNSRWHHAPGRENPADHASRGLSPQRLKEETLWWNGPSWLSKHSTFWPSTAPPLAEDVTLEIREKTVATPVKTHCDEAWELVRRYSRLPRLLRTTAWVIRATQRMRRKEEVRLEVTVSSRSDHTKRARRSSPALGEINPIIVLLARNTTAH